MWQTYPSYFLQWIENRTPWILRQQDPLKRACKRHSVEQRSLVAILLQRTYGGRNAAKICVISGMKSARYSKSKTETGDISNSTFRAGYNENAINLLLRQELLDIITRANIMCCSYSCLQCSLPSKGLKISNRQEIWPTHAINCGNILQRINSRHNAGPCCISHSKRLNERTKRYICQTGVKCKVVTCQNCGFEFV